ncbi:hypothetical protein P8452_46307 [Trifolium repens]|nr:hypothetical protein P8452_46190 [Trifolium repens]WJX61191.1 hypothetical protein P8452_46307 [Trifolium repens]
MILSQRSLSLTSHNLAANPHIERAVSVTTLPRLTELSVSIIQLRIWQTPCCFHPMNFHSLLDIGVGCDFCENSGFVSITEASTFWHRVVVFVRFCYAAILVPAAGGDLIVFWFGGDHGREGFDLHIPRRIKCPDDYE